MSLTVGIRDAKARLSHYVEIARTDGEVIITDRGKPVARLTGIRGAQTPPLDDVLHDMAEAGLIDLGVSRGARAEGIALSW